jgi:arsenate reductase
MANDRPLVLFVCRRNAGRSQMAAGLLERDGGDRVRVASAGLSPAEEINPTTVEAMSEVGVDLSTRRPRVLDEREAVAASVIVTMGCGDECPTYPGVPHVYWDVPDPSGEPLEDVRRIRDEIAGRVRSLWEELGSAT